MVNIFASWSLERSRQAAHFFVEWLPQVLQDVEIFFSPEMEKGIRSLDEIATQLELSNYGIAFLTPENLESTWIHFEAGGLVKLRDRGKLAAILCCGLKRANVKPPLSQFQNVLPSKEDVYRLIGSINGHQTNPVPTDRLKKIFEKWWPDLATEFERIATLPVTDDSRETADEGIRSQMEKVDELLELVRHLNEQVGSGPRRIAQQLAARRNELQFVQTSEIRCSSVDGIEEAEQIRERIDKILWDVAKRIKIKATEDGYSVFVFFEDPFPKDFMDGYIHTMRAEGRKISGWGSYPYILPIVE